MNSAPTLLRFLVWLIWCYAARWPFFHDQISISIIPILVIQAMNGGITSLNAVVMHPQHPPLGRTHPSNMTFVSNDPSWRPYIDSQFLYSYWIVAAGVVVVYDWVLTIGQEIDLIWRQRWSLMTMLYLVIRYIGIPYSVVNVLVNMPVVSLTDTVSNILYYAINWTNVVITAMLGVIMVARLHAMYQGSRTMLIFLVVIFLAVNIACMALTAIGLKYFVAEEGILFGIHMCGYDSEGDLWLLFVMIWILNTVWEVLALCLSVWIAVKHFRDLRRLGPSTGSTIGDCFRVLIQSHVLYFASFAGVSCLELISLSPAFLDSVFIGSVIFSGTRNVLLIVQMFVLGPRLILSVRGYHAKLVAGSDADASMNSIVFQEHVHISTSGTV
ncbi:hypothetical protein CY34DRAFT_185804 [Suillus luteus UH-Slu-Lm8-n1]|uniref:DUF6533 domain-containing protein n=1 Tax=Suillus luteus UH-Slu-Lm8-n1 TaxID=930992 RepID=A0A0D0B5P7_9AGAM|nr:hypothetical protein CY34DRAFT_185804 [Suillus luteus UH-Slu-Lm8-n1]